MQWLLPFILALMVQVSPLQAQTVPVQQGGTVTSGHVAVWAAPGVIRDAQSATGSSYITSLGITSAGGLPFCVNSGPVTSAYDQLCLSVLGTSAATIYNTAMGGLSSIPLNINSNGTVVASFYDSYVQLSSLKLTTALASTYMALDSNFVDNSGSLGFASIAAGKIIGNSTSSLAEPTATTVTEILDQALGSTQGSIIYRSGSAWVPLTPGVSGQVLQSNGVGANPSWSTVSGTGTVTSVAMTGDNVVFNTTVTGSPIVNSGTLVPSLKTQSANTVLAGPTSSTAAPTFRALVPNDIAMGSGSIASATTTDLGSVTSTLVTVTASNGITSFGSSAPSGTIKILTFTGAPTISQSASLVLANFQNHTVTPGETMTFYTSGSGNWVQISGSQPPIVPARTFTNLAGAYATTTTATWTADELVLKNALGSTPILITSFNKTLDISGTGAGKLDTGTAANTTWYYVYAIVKADGTQNIVATTTCTGNCVVYGGANMPAGYVASALIGQFYTNGSAQINIFSQKDNRVFLGVAGSLNSRVLANGTQTGYTSVSMAAAVPPNAKTWQGLVTQNAGGNYAAFISPDSGGTTNAYVQFQTGAAYTIPSIDIPLLTAQTCWYKVAASGNIFIDVNSYTF